MLTVALTEGADHPAWGRSVGEAVESRMEGMDRRVIGNAQGWYYPADRILVLWECEAFYLYGAAPGYPTEDFALITVWEAFESLLLNKFTDVKQIITPGWEPKYQDELWITFLRGRGYIPLDNDQRAFTKKQLN